MAYERDDGTLHYWRFDEPFPGVQAARNADSYAWLNDGRLAFATPSQLDYIRVTDGERETLAVSKSHRVIDVHPDGHRPSLFP